MNDSLALLQELLPELAAYAHSTTEQTMAGFADWLQRRVATQPPTAELPPQEPAFLNRLAPLTQLGPLVSRVHYFTQQRAQQLLDGLGSVASLRDFVVLAAIANNQQPTKSEVAAMSLLELSTITEVTRRLVQAGLVRETSDEHDRRARRLQVSPAGLTLLRQAETQLAQLHPHIYASLAPSEQEELRRLLSLVNTHLTSELGRKESR